MTHEELAVMAQKAGCIPRRSPEHWNDVQVFATPEALMRFYELVSAHECEACALIADKAEPYQAADLIRARGRHDPTR